MTALPPAPRSSPAETASLTALLHEWRKGSGTAFERVFDQAYEHLKAIAIRRLGRFGGSPTLSATDLLHEALLGVIPSEMEWQDRSHFFATMSLAMRSVLVDHARARVALKRGGGRLRVTLNDEFVAEEKNVVDMIAIDHALTKLEQFDARSGAATHLTYFAGLRGEEVADLLKVSLATVERDLRFARGWLRVELRDAT